MQKEVGVGKGPAMATVSPKKYLRISSTMLIFALFYFYKLHSFIHSLFFLCQMIDKQIRWQLRNPNGTAEECVAFLKNEMMNNLHSSADK